MEILNLALYRFQPLQGLAGLREDLLRSCREKELKGTVLLAPEGLNAFVAGLPAAVEAFELEVAERLGDPTLRGKRSWSDFVPFRRLFVKVKSAIIPYPEEVPVASRRGTSIEARELKRWYDEGREFVMLDTRNEFEVEMGTFEKARSLGLKNFREFSAQAAQLDESLREKPVVVFCTGGIRCEKASLDLERQGFRNVLQLEGGILKYFEECGDVHYKGRCFVFDERVSLNGRLEAVNGRFCEKGTVPHRRP